MIIAPKISIVTPSFNQGEFLEECIDSILSQNYPNLEYIIMDGGSTDNSVEIIKKYEKYLTYWRSGRDAGQYAAIDEGFKKTTGEIMAWLNSDDKYHHLAFYKVAYIFSKHRDIEWVTGRPTVLDKDANVYWIYEHLPTFCREKYLKKIYRDPFIQQESTFWRRSLWEKAGGMLSSDLTYAGDLELWRRFFRVAQLYTVDTLVGGYRLHGNQKAALFMDKYAEEAEKVLNSEIELFYKGGKTDLVPAPTPLSVPHNEVKSYIDALYASMGHSIYKLSDDSDLVCNYLITKLSEVVAESATKSEIIDGLKGQLEEREVERSAKVDEVNAMRSSMSWRITAPLRWVSDKLRRP